MEMQGYIKQLLAMAAIGVFVAGMLVIRQFNCVQDYAGSHVIAGLDFTKFAAFFHFC